MADPLVPTYVVQRGDYLSAIAKKLGRCTGPVTCSTAASLIAFQNGIVNADLIEPGWVLVVPDDVRAEDGSFLTARRVFSQTIAARNGVRPPPDVADSGDVTQPAARRSGWFSSLLLWGLGGLALVFGVKRYAIIAGQRGR